MLGFSEQFLASFSSFKVCKKFFEFLTSSYKPEKSPETIEVFAKNKIQIDKPSTFKIRLELKGEAQEAYIFLQGQIKSNTVVHQNSDILCPVHTNKISVKSRLTVKQEEDPHPSICLEI